MKKLLTSLLCVMMVVCFMPAMAWADGTTLPSATEGTITLTEDVTLSEYTVNENTTVEIDLAGHTLNLGQGTLLNKGTLTIKDSSTGETGKIVSSVTNGNVNGPDIKGTITNEGTLNVLGGTIDALGNQTPALANKENGKVYLTKGRIIRSAEDSNNTTESGGNNSCYAIMNRGYMEINEGVEVVQNGHFSSLVQNGWYAGSNNTNGVDAVMIIKGGTFTGGINTIKNDDYGVLTISGGTFNNTTQASLLNWNVTTINGGTFESEGYAILNGYADDTYDKGQLTITDGTFSSAATTIEKMSGGNIGQVIIQGGTFENTSEDGQTLPESLNGGSILVTGGTFTTDASDYIPDGMTQDEDGNVVINEDTAVAKVNGVGYTTLQAAIEAAQDGDTITLLDNITTGDNGKGNNEGVFTITKDLTIDGAKHKISAGDGFNVTTSTTGSKQSASMFNVEEGAMVTFKDLTIDGKDRAKHGINVFSSDAGKISNVTVKNVTIENCNGYAIVNNGSDVTVNSITTSDNDWGGINVDSSDSSKQPASLTINDASISEENSVYFENASNSKITGNITGGTFANVTVAGKAGTTEDIDNVTLTISGGTFVNDVSGYVADASKVYKKGDSYIVAASAPANSSGYNTWELVDGVYVEKYVSTGGYVPTTPTAQKPVIEPNADVTTSLSTDGTTLTIKANDGYEITDVTVNGVSKGAVTTLTGLKTGDKIVIKSQKIETPDDNAALIEAVKNTKLIARSAMSTAKGKKAVKVSWYAADGSDLDFDGYEVFRSLKRYSGFGTTPIFKTANEKYYNTAIKKGNKYYYKVRAYKVIDGEKVYTDWSTKAWRTVK